MRTICFVICVILASPLSAHSQAKSPNACPSDGQEVRRTPENLLEEYRRRQRIRELYVTGHVLLVVGQAAVVHRFAPEKARQLLQDATRKIKDDPDITAWPRAALLVVLLDLSADLEALFGFP
jgi:hypothetical protein